MEHYTLKNVYTTQAGKFYEGALYDGGVASIGKCDRNGYCSVSFSCKKIRNVLDYVRNAR